MTDWFEIVALVLVIGFGLLLFVMLTIRNERERQKKEAADRRELTEFVVSELKKIRAEKETKSDDPFLEMYELSLWPGEKNR